MAATRRARLSAAWFLFVLAPALGATKGADSDANCDATRQVSVSGSENLASETSYRATRDSLLRSLLVEAATIVNGADITARRSSGVTAVNDDISAVIESYETIKARGLIVSYSFPMHGEAVVETDIGPMLRLNLDVVVCDQSSVRPRVYIKIQGVNFTNFREFEKDLTAIVAGAIPAESDLIYIDGSQANAYYDYVVSGQVLSVAATVEENRWLRALGQTVTASGQPIVDSRQHRLSAIIQMKAYHPADDTYTLVHETVEKTISIKSRDGALARSIDEFIVEALDSTSLVLFEKIIKQRDFKKVRSR